jgi:hypothetical protein
MPPSPKLGSVKCSWDPSVAPNITNYTVGIGTSSKIYGNSQDFGTNLTATIPGLFRGITYYFAATATDSNGLTSDFSNEASCVIPMAPGSPLRFQSSNKIP